MLRRLAVVSILASAVSCGLTGCEDEKQYSNAPQDIECNIADKTSENCTCNKSTGLWENCGSVVTCKCDDGTTDCPNGDKTQCTVTDACDGKACKAAGTCSDDGGVCKCSNGGDIANDCAATTDACEGKACKATGTCSDVSGTCTCNNGKRLIKVRS